jgi:hypothetical protein
MFDRCVSYGIMREVDVLQIAHGLYDVAYVPKTGQIEIEILY